LGRSLGIDLVPFKTCTYDCIYCQLGRTTNKTLERREYVPVEEVLAELERKLATADSPDYISLAGSGEPTLNSGIGEMVSRIKKLTNIPVAVLTNGSLLSMGEVQDALMKADLVLPSLDAGDQHIFHYVNRPHRDISFETMVEGIASFTKRFSGQVWLEVFLLGGVNSIPAEVEKIAAFVRRIRPDRVQLNTVSRPPVEEYAYPLPEKQMHVLKGLFPGVVEVISPFKQVNPVTIADSPFQNTEIISLLGRRPCTANGVASGLGINPIEATKRLQVLCQQRILKHVHRDGELFYELARDI